VNTSPGENRLHALDAVRSFALLSVVAFHAAMSFFPDQPPGWQMVDNSPSVFLGVASFVMQIFQMSLFFFIAGYFGRLLYHKLGPGGFWANRSMRILVPMIVFWMILKPPMFAIGGMAAMKMYNGPPPGMADPPVNFFPLLHLWFLYYLLLLYVAVIAVRAVLVRLDSTQKLRSLVDRGIAVAIRQPIGVLVFGLPLAATLLALPSFNYWGIPTPGFSLTPQVPATVGYGTAFIVGWLVNRSQGAQAAVESRWVVHLVLAVITSVWLLNTHVTPFAQPELTKTLFACIFGVALWSWVFGLTGAALRFLSSYNPVRRYVADASYWIYLMHMPVVAALAVWVGFWPLHWSIKYPFILAVCFTVLFLSYHYFVRPTFIGKLLNGRKHPRKPAPQMPPPSTHAA
jgi:peptidoglycan/LPS O-acetylase OafA/YrhL